MAEELKNEELNEELQQEEIQIEDQENEENLPKDENSADETAAAEPTPEEKYNELNNKYLRLYSDFENFRKRTAKERMELFDTAGADTISKMLPIMDDFDRAIANNEKTEDVAALKEGFTLIYNKLKNTFEQMGVKEMEATGTDFNTDMHEALTNIPAPSEDLKGKVVDVAEKGYLLKEKVIRFAKVIVGQ